MSASRFAWFLAMSMLGAASAAACGSSDDGSTFDGGPGDASGGDGDLGDASLGGDAIFGGDALGGGDASNFTLTVEPPNAIIDVSSGQALPSQTYVAKANGAIVVASFSVDRGEIAAINASTGVLTPQGALGGVANVTATYKGKTASTKVTVRLHVTQNGSNAGADAGGGGAGGNGGVGGEGQGGAVSPGTQGALGGSPKPDAGLAWLYPYDKTVWPRGLLAPLLQWQPGSQSYDAVYIHITENAYEYKGYFAKTATPFVHHPIPQDVWKQLTYSNGGEPVSVSLTFSAGGVAYGPITEQWTIANGVLKGTVYYNSYGTNLAHNYCCTIGGAKFGGATLAIRGGSTDPVLVAGNDSACRVCHSVAANGSRLITQQDNNSASSMYDLLSANAETGMSPADGRYAWPAMYPDGTMLFSNSAPEQAGNTSLASTLYQVPSGTALPSTGLPADLHAACPAFSPDGKHLAFNYYAGTGSDGISLATMDFDKASSTFSNLGKVYTPSAGKVVWPSFLPTSAGVVFELETVSNNRTFGETRSTCDGSGACSNVGAHAELWWLDTKTKQAARLDQANGKGYLPTLAATQHDDDSTLNYEPTMNPVPSGGYAWVVFTSRRLYGNIATINPYWSDPRYHDISTTPTPKKLWVAAIDLNATPGTDPSHPAFYLPGQELLAGNSRGYWVVDPCKKDGNSCETGDECCGGYCRQNGDGGALVCSDTTPSCSQEFDKCKVDADCCGNPMLQCIGGLCSRPSPR